MGEGGKQLHGIRSTWRFLTAPNEHLQQDIEQGLKANAREGLQLTHGNADKGQPVVLNCKHGQYMGSLLGSDGDNMNSRCSGAIKGGRPGFI